MYCFTVHESLGFKVEKFTYKEPYESSWLHS